MNDFGSAKSTLRNSEHTKCTYCTYYARTLSRGNEIFCSAVTCAAVTCPRNFECKMNNLKQAKCHYIGPRCPRRRFIRFTVLFTTGSGIGPLHEMPPRVPSHLYLCLHSQRKWPICRYVRYLCLIGVCAKKFVFKVYKSTTYSTFGDTTQDTICMGGNVICTYRQVVEAHRIPFLPQGNE